MKKETIVLIAAVALFAVGIILYNKKASVTKNSDGSISYDPNATDANTKLAYRVLGSQGFGVIPNQFWNLSYSFDKTMDIINKLDSNGLAALNRLVYNKYDNKSDMQKDADIFKASLTSSIPDYMAKYGNNPTQVSLKDYTDKDCIIYANVYVQEAIVAGGLNGNDTAALQSAYQKILDDLKKGIADAKSTSKDATEVPQQNNTSPSSGGIVKSEEVKATAEPISSSSSGTSLKSFAN